MPVVSFYFNEMSTTDIYTLSLHDALPIWARGDRTAFRRLVLARFRLRGSGLGPCTDRGSKPTQLAFPAEPRRDRKSTRLNSSHLGISYAVFCLKKKKQNKTTNKQSQCRHE